jgi:hypothetical protein
MPANDVRHLKPERNRSHCGSRSLSIVAIEVGKPENRLFHLKRSDVRDEVVDMLLTRRVVNWIECLKTGSPDGHVFRTMRSETLAKGQHNSNVAGWKLILMSP